MINEASAGAMSVCCKKPLTRGTMPWMNTARGPCRWRPGNHGPRQGRRRQRCKPPADHLSTSVFALFGKGTRGCVASERQPPCIIRPTSCVGRLVKGHPEGPSRRAIRLKPGRGHRDRLWPLWLDKAVPHSRHLSQSLRQSSLL